MRYEVVKNRKEEWVVIQYDIHNKLVAYWTVTSEEEGWKLVNRFRLDDITKVWRK